MKAYLVDTDIMVDVSRNSQAAVDYIENLGQWSLSAITSLELIAGARYQREVVETDLILSAYPRIPLNEDITRRAYYLMKTYARGAGLHTLDSLIAATALEEGLTLATKNRKHFQMIAGLQLDVPSY
jgi:predicted nucleic acid-binding protein